MSNLGERIKEINDRIDAEFSRRKYIGSLADKVSPLSEISPSDDFILPYVEKIKDLLVVNKKQFSQICMIAQGDFRKLLDADTKSRIEIFRNIFSIIGIMTFD